MKTTKLALFVFVFSTVLFTSCDPNAIDGNSNYWNSSTLVRLKLNGHVKILTQNNGSQIDEFNLDGYITKSVYTTTDFSSTTIYNYAPSGELTSIDFSSTGGKGVDYSTNFLYNVNGKYVLQNQYHLLVDALVPNLKSVSNQFSRTDYVFDGNTMLLIYSYTAESIPHHDTTYVAYSGKYPVSLSSANNFVNDITYATNGMFLSYTSGNQGEGYYNESNYYFKPNDKFLLIDSVVHNSTNQSITSRTVDKYIYDDKNNVIYEESFSSNYEYSYVYDSLDNWTSKTTRYKPKDTTTWGAPTTETRVITYW